MGLFDKMEKAIQDGDVEAQGISSPNRTVVLLFLLIKHTFIKAAQF